MPAPNPGSRGSGLGRRHLGLCSHSIFSGPLLCASPATVRTLASGSRAIQSIKTRFTHKVRL